MKTLGHNAKVNIAAMTLVAPLIMMVIFRQLGLMTWAWHTRMPEWYGGTYASAMATAGVIPAVLLFFIWRLWRHQDN